MKTSTRPDKRLMIHFEDGIIVHFGARDGRTFIDHKDPKIKAAWMARHKHDRGWDDPSKGIFYSRHLLWGAEPSISKQLAYLKRSYKIDLRNAV